MSKTAEQCIAEEGKTHRRLTATDVFEKGDVYGGDDWGFLFTIGSDGVEKPKPGDLVGISAQSHYRYRRPL